MSEWVAPPTPAVTPSLDCPECGFQLWIPIWPLSVSTLGFYDDSRFPGRCILALNSHHEHLATLETGLASAYMRDIQEAGRAISTVVASSRMNYAIFGNSVPHLHCHIVPRHRAGDPSPERPPWESPLKKQPLLPAIREQLVSAIREILMQQVIALPQKEE